MEVSPVLSLARNTLPDREEQDGRVNIISRVRSETESEASQGENFWLTRQCQKTVIHCPPVAKLSKAVLFSEYVAKLS